MNGTPMPPNTATLLIDSGNTRLKWRFWAKSTGWVQGVCDKPDPGLAVHTMPPFSDWDKLPEVAHHVWVAHVAHPGFKDQLTEYMNARVLNASFTHQIHWFESAPEWQGLKNGYLTPTTLGMDRWLNLIEAHSRYPHQDLMIIALGTAITVDVLQKNGQHVGGFIVPGLQAIEKYVQPLGAIEPIEWISHWIESLAQSLRVTPSSIMKVLLTGGDAEVVASHLRPSTELSIEIIEEGVLNGLERVAHSESASLGS